MTLEQAAQACDAAFKLHITAMTSKTQSIQANPCFGSSTDDLLKAGFEQGDSSQARAEIARRAMRKGIPTQQFLLTKFKGMQRKADKAKEVATPKATPKVVKAEVVAPTVASIPSQADAVAQLFAMLQQAGLVTTVNLPAKAPVVAAPAATHPDVARNCKVLVADAIRLKDRNGLKNALVELELIPEGCRLRFDALVKVAEQLNVNVKKHKAPASVPNLSVQFGNMKFTN
jgi:hypothetical protein